MAINDTRVPDFSTLMGSFGAYNKVPDAGDTTSTGTGGYDTKMPSAADLVGESASANLAAAPSLSSLGDLVSRINQQAYLSAPGRAQSLQAIQGRVAGNISEDTVRQAQLDAAERYGGSGFGVDSGTWQSAIQRALGLKREELIGQGLGELNQFYSGMPNADIQKFMLTPSDYGSYAASKQREANEQAKLAEQQREFAANLAMAGEQFKARLALDQAKLNQQEALAKAQLYAAKPQLFPDIYAKALGGGDITPQGTISSGGTSFNPGGWPIQTV